MSVLMCVGTHVPGRSLRFAVFTLPSRQMGGDGTACTISCIPHKTSAAPCLLPTWTILVWSSITCATRPAVATISSDPSDTLCRLCSTWARATISCTLHWVCSTWSRTRGNGVTLLKHGKASG